MDSYYSFGTKAKPMNSKVLDQIFPENSLKIHQWVSNCLLNEKLYSGFLCYMLLHGKSDLKNIFLSLILNYKQ